MPPSATARDRKVFDALMRHGVLLEADSRLPSVVSIVAGEAVQGSWWGHPQGHDIFAACQALHDNDEVLTVKLISGKVTYVHRELWSNLVALATCGEDWQFEGLSPHARSLYEKVEAEGMLRTDLLDKRMKGDSEKVGVRVRELEERLLVYTTFLHTEKGTHAKAVESWATWLERVRAESALAGKPRAKKAREIFEVIVESLNEKYGGDATLPWSQNGSR